MKVFIIEPRMTMTDAACADEFNEVVIEQLEEYGVEHYVVNNKNIERLGLNLSEDTLVLIYNEHCMVSNDSKVVETLLNKAKVKDSEIWPIAIDREARTPMGIISDKQSYDIWEQLRCRDLDEQYIQTIAKIFSRKIIARVFPTCYCEEGEIFLSHRRVDGEEITAQICDKMLVQAKQTTPFRDVVKVKVGDAAQTVIDKAMGNSDVFVFVHTPESSESDWILKELRFALLRHIPILWVQIDNADPKKLKVKPSDEPHIQYASEEFADEERVTRIVDEILQKAFELVMERSNQILGYVELIGSMFGEKLSTLDREKMIYHISMERKGYHYPQRNIEQYYQLFGRTPTLEDARKLNDELKEYDSDSIAILTNRVVSSSIHDNVVFDGVQDFCYHWNKYISDEKKGDDSMEIIISGAFPDSDEIFKQSLTDALIMFGKAIIRNGYELTFGAHPTFQELFYEIAKEIAPKDYKNKVNMYISRWFLEHECEKELEYREKYSVYISHKKEDLPQSLTEMRKDMIQRNRVKALVCLGGKIKPNEEDEGIREEIKLAQEWNIPVFVVGSVGGCSGKIAIEHQSTGWSKLNDASSEINQEFLEGIDYFGMAQKMIKYLDSKESNKD